MAATRWISPSPSPSRRQPRRSDSSRSFKVSRSISRGFDGSSFEKTRKAREPELVRDGTDARRPLTRRKPLDPGQCGEERVRLQLPFYAVQPLARTAHREKVPDNTEGEVVARHVRTGESRQGKREQEPNRVQGQPSTVTVQIDTQAPANDRQRAGVID